MTQNGVDANGHDQRTPLIQGKEGTADVKCLPRMGREEAYCQLCQKMMTSQHAMRASIRCTHSVANRTGKSKLGKTEYYSVQVLDKNKA